MAHHNNSWMVYWLHCMALDILWNSVVQNVLIILIHCYKKKCLKILAHWKIAENVWCNLVFLTVFNASMSAKYNVQIDEDLLIIYAKDEKKISNYVQLQLIFMRPLTDHVPICHTKQFSKALLPVLNENGRYSKEVATWSFPASRATPVVGFQWNHGH